MTPKQHRFVQEYLVDLNATQAAIRAGYSPRTARSVGSENLTKPDIASAIQTAGAQLAARTGITAERVLSELELLAFSNLEHYVVGDDGTVTLSSEAPAGAMRALQSIKRRTTTKGRGFDLEVTREVEIRLWDKPGPLKLAGQHVGLFTNKVEVTGKDGAPLNLRGLTDAELALMAALAEKCRPA